MNKVGKEKDKVRLDKYLWSIRVFKTRAQATDACNANKVKFNGVTAKPSRIVKIGDRYLIKGEDRNWDIEVTGILAQRKAYSEAINFYIDHTEVDEKTSNKMSSSFYTGKRPSKIGRPTKKDRRDLDDLLGLT